MDTMVVVISRGVKDQKSCSDHFPLRERPGRGIHWENLGQSNPSSALPSPLLLFCFLCNAMDRLSAERRTTASGPEGLGSAQHLRAVLDKLDEKDGVERLEYPPWSQSFHAFVHLALSG